MKIKHLFLLLFSVAGVQLALADCFYKVKAEYLMGQIMRGTRIDPLIERPVMGAELALEFQPEASHQWMMDYNRASLGVAAAYLNLGNNEKLGNAFALYPYLNIPLVRTPHFILSLKPGAGISLVDRYYANTSDNRTLGIQNAADSQNIANSAFGSVLNVYFTGAVTMEFPISKGFSLSASYGWNHISNGSFIQPNSGINMFNAQVGLVYFPHYEQYSLPEKTPSDRTYKRFSFDVIASGGARQLYYVDNKFFGIASLSVGAYYRCAKIFQIGLGADAFYDGVYANVNAGTADRTSAFKFTYLEESRVENCFRAGLSVRPELVIGRLTAGLHFGVYLYDPIKNLEPYSEAQQGPLNKGIFYRYDINKSDGWLYTRASLKYEVTPHLLLAIGLKTHLQRAEFIEWGIGYRF